MPLRLPGKSVNATLAGTALVEAAALCALGSILIIDRLKVIDVLLLDVACLSLVRRGCYGYRQVVSQVTMCNLTFRAGAGRVFWQAKSRRQRAAA